MSHTPHTYDLPAVQTKEFELVAARPPVPRSFSARHQRPERTKSNSGPAVASSLSDFHEEFKTLVLASKDEDSEDLTEATFIELFEPHELELFDVPTSGASHRSPVASAAPSKAVHVPMPVLTMPPQQVVRQLSGPRPGTPMPIEAWVVKVIFVLVALNLLFASLVVTGFRISDLFK